MLLCLHTLTFSQRWDRCVQNPIIHAFYSADGSVWAHKSIQHLDHLQGCPGFCFLTGFLHLFGCMCMPWQPWVRGWLESVSTPHASGKSKVYGVLISNPDGYLTSQNVQLNTLLLLPCLPQTGLQPQARELCVLARRPPL